MDKIGINKMLNKKERILVTGNMGYIGVVMVKLLRKEGYYVVGLDSGWFKGNSFYQIPKFSKPDKQIIKDIRFVTENDLKGISKIIHLAALSNDPLGELNHNLTEEINYKSTIRIAEISKRIGAERFVFASSCSIYGRANDETPISENGELNPITAYAKTKVSAERGLKELADCNFHPVVMRNATVYGVSPMLRLDLVVNNLLAWAYLTNEINIMSNGEPWRPIVHIEDFCRAFIAVLKAPADTIHCQVYNVGLNEENYRVKDIAEEIKNVLPKSRIKILNKTGVDERTYKVDFSKIKNTFSGFKPQWNLRRGIVELLSVYKKYKLSIYDFNSDRYFRIRAIKKLIRDSKLDDMLFVKNHD